MAWAFANRRPPCVGRRIVKLPVAFPREPATSPEAKDLIRQFCTVDRSKRLGNLSGGAARVKQHAFFEAVDWDDVYHRRSKGPIIPTITAPDDSQCFEQYPEDSGGHAEYTDEMAATYDKYFSDF
jgi:protein kinase A